MLAFSKSRYFIEFLSFGSSRRGLTPVLTFSFFPIKDQNTFVISLLYRFRIWLSICKFNLLSDFSCEHTFSLVGLFQHQVVFVSTFCVVYCSLLFYTSNLYLKDLQMKFSKYSIYHVELGHKHLKGPA